MLTVWVVCPYLPSSTHPFSLLHSNSMVTFQRLDNLHEGFPCEKHTIFRIVGMFEYNVTFKIGYFFATVHFVILHISTIHTSWTLCKNASNGGFFFAYCFAEEVKSLMVDVQLYSIFFSCDHSIWTAPFLRNHSRSFLLEWKILNIFFWHDTSIEHLWPLKWHPFWIFVLLVYFEKKTLIALISYFYFVIFLLK